MRRLLLVMLLSLPAIAFADPNPCYRKPATPISIPPGTDYPVTLEARRVVDVQGKSFTYDLGTRKISIEATDFAAEQLLGDIHRGVCISKVKVVLIPHFLGNRNDRFRTRSPRR